MKRGTGNNLHDNTQLERLDRLLKEIVPKLASSLEDEARLIKTIAEEAKGLVNAHHVHIRVIKWIAFDWENDELEMVRCDGEGKDVLNEYDKFRCIKVKQAIGGRIFRKKVPDKFPDIQKDPDFQKYLGEIEKSDPQTAVISYLKRFGPAIVVPFLLGKKPIGILTALRLRKGVNEPLPQEFTEDDKKILMHFADHAAIALRNAWLFEAAIWQPPTDLIKLWKKVKEVAQKMTGAYDLRVRFFDWEEKRLVPGDIQWPRDIGEEDPEVCVRQIGIGPVGRIAESGANRLYRPKDLREDPAFQEFIRNTQSRVALYFDQLNVLQQWKKSVYNGNKEERKLEIPEGICQEARDELEKRREILEKLLEEPAATNEGGEKTGEKIVDSFKRQMDVVTHLKDAWAKYLGFLETLNSEIATLIISGGKVIGVLNVHSKEEEWFTEGDEAILQALAGRVASAITEYQRNVLNRIEAIEQEMTAGCEFEDIADLIADAIKEVAFLTDPKKKVHIFPLLYPCKKPEYSKELSEDQENFGKKFEPQIRKSATQEELRLLNVQIRNDGLGWEAISILYENPQEPVFIVRENVNDPISGGSPSAQEEGVKTTACLPLVFNSIVYGLLYIHIKEKYFFNKLEKEILNLFAAQAAIVVKNIKRRAEEPTFDSFYGRSLIEEVCSYEA